MLRPEDIAPSNYGIALKPLLGKEKKIKISAKPAIEVASIEVTGANAVTTTTSVAGAGALAARPSELLIKLEEELSADAAMVIGVVGTDENDAVLSGSARFAPPAYAQEQSFVFPAGTAREVVVTGNKKFKTITSIVPTSIPVSAKYGRLSLFGMPPMDSFVLVGCRTNLSYATETRHAVAVACGGDDSAFVKPGQKPQREVSVTVKVPSLSDGLARYDGKSNIVLLAVSEKEGRVVTDHEFLIGVTLSARRTDPEASEPSTLEATGIYEDYAHLPAGPLS